LAASFGHLSLVLLRQMHLGQEPDNREEKFN